jgi:hypothetical protein
MALLQTVELTRTSVDVKLFGYSDIGIQLNTTFDRIQKKYLDSGQLISKAQNKTSDLLTFSYAFLWKSKEDFEAYINEEELKGAIVLRKQYELNNNITRKVTTVEV